MSETCRGCGREHDCAPDCLFQEKVLLGHEITLLEARLKRAFVERDEWRALTEAEETMRLHRSAEKQDDARELWEQFRYYHRPNPFAPLLDGDKLAIEAFASRALGRGENLAQKREEFRVKIREIIDDRSNTAAYACELIKEALTEGREEAETEGTDDE